MSKIDQATVEQVAKLARLSFEQQQLAPMASEMAEILGYVDQLGSVEQLSGCDPFYGAVEPETASDNATRSDEVAESRSRDSMLANAPDTDGEYYQVPPVF